MVDFFPMPYPDESWYSLMCRYNVRCGHKSSARTIRQFVSRNQRSTFCSLMPSKTMFDVINELPEGILDIDDMILNHTLFKYRYRLFDLDLKRKLYNDFKTRKLEVLPHTFKNPPALRWCPMCKEEDIRTYGESYWHVSHQIPTISICQKHKCNLITVKRQKKGISFQTLIPFDPKLEGEIVFNTNQTEIRYNEILYEFLNLPYEKEPMQNCTYILNKLSEKGFRILNPSGRICNKEVLKLKETMKKACSQELIQCIYGKEIYLRNLICQLLEEKLTYPEKYAMIVALVDTLPDIDFVDNDVKKAKQIQTLIRENNKISKAQISREMDMTAWEVTKIMKKYHLEEEWNQYTFYNRTLTGSIHVSIPEDKKDIYSKYMIHKKYQSYAEMFRQCAENEMRREGFLTDSETKA